MAGATFISRDTPRNAKRDSSPTARNASNKKATVLSNKQEPEHETETVSCTFFDPVLNNYEPTRKDLFSIEPRIKDYLKRVTPKDLSYCLTTVIVEEEFSPRSVSVLPTPTSASGLYHNLIHILSTRTSRPPIAALLDYHQLFPDHRSVKSYNLLISLSIHHRAYGTTHKLLREMQAHSIQQNIETHRLLVRCLIFQGFWVKAWSYAKQLTKKFPEGNNLFPIWLEFCQSRVHGPIWEGKVNSKTRKQLLKDAEPPAIFYDRRIVMDSNRPLSIPALEHTPPAGIRNIVQLMVKNGLNHQALKLTEDYFRTLPLKMDSRMNHRCLDIVKIHLVSNGRRKTGLIRLNETKKLFFSLMSINPSLRPTSDALMFILSILKDVKSSGTVAWKFISFCKEKWGPEIEDRQIQKRVSSLALKEGRLDIVENILRAELMERRSRQNSIHERRLVGDLVRPPAKVIQRPSLRRIYPHNGREAFLWHHHRIRFHRTVKKRELQGRPFTRRARLSKRQRALTQKPTNSIQ
jgi:hypothetical protein